MVRHLRGYDIKPNNLTWSEPALVDYVRKSASQTEN